jgi:hypothetical protein
MSWVVRGVPWRALANEPACMCGMPRCEAGRAGVGAFRRRSRGYERRAGPRRAKEDVADEHASLRREHRASSYSGCRARIPAAAIARTSSLMRSAIAIRAAAVILRYSAMWKSCAAGDVSSGRTRRNPHPSLRPVELRASRRVTRRVQTGTAMGAFEPGGTFP